MTKGVDLHHLQRLDSEGDDRRCRLAEVEAALGESEALRWARRAVESAQSQIQQWALRQRDLELEIQGLSDKISGSEQRLYSGVVKNPKELTDLQAEVASLRRRRQKLEDDLLEAMIEVEKAEAACAQAQQHLGETQAHWSAQQADLIGEREALLGRLAEIEQARAALLPKIEASDLAAYQALRRRKRGLAVVQVCDGTCGGCGVAVSPGLEWQLRQGKLVTCGNCERIIVQKE
jgi:predicted  nucleic acid-binding Zn-ribbon protein